MGKKRCIDVQEICIAAAFAVSTGNSYIADNYGNVVEYSVSEPNSKGERLFSIDKPKSHMCLSMNTYGELVRNSVTADKCKLYYYDTSRKEYCYANWWDTVLVNNPKHPLCGCLVRREDGYIIADNSRVFD